eukprot:1807197-Amphidinium_carterae.1
MVRSKERIDVSTLRKIRAFKRKTQVTRHKKQRKTLGQQRRKHAAEAKRSKKVANASGSWRAASRNPTSGKKGEEAARRKLQALSLMAKPGTCGKCGRGKYKSCVDQGRHMY